MSGVQEISMADSHESKLEAVLRAIKALTARIEALENFVIRVGINLGAKISQSTQHIAVKGPTPLSSQKNNCSNQNLNSGAAKFRESRVNFLEKFDGTRLKFRGFVNHDQDKARSTTTKIRILRQGSRPASVYASDFRLLACNINWNKEALMNHFHWGL
jgi:hypothetical protein